MDREPHCNPYTKIYFGGLIMEPTTAQRHEMWTLIDQQLLEKAIRKSIDENGYVLDEETHTLQISFMGVTATKHFPLEEEIDHSEGYQDSWEDLFEDDSTASPLLCWELGNEGDTECTLFESLLYDVGNQIVSLLRTHRDQKAYKLHLASLRIDADLTTLLDYV